MNRREPEIRQSVDRSVVEHLAAKAATLLGADTDRGLAAAGRASAAPRRRQLRPVRSKERALAPLPRVRSGTRPWGDERPRTRADCIDRPRPCPWLGLPYTHI